MNNFWIFQYGQGALIRNNYGFSSIHSWTNLGDNPVEYHLESIKNNTPTTLAKKSLYYLKLDSESRINSKKLFTIETINKYLTLHDESSIRSFLKKDSSKISQIKIKISSDTFESKLINEFTQFNGSIIFDCNATFNYNDFINFWGSLSENIKNKVIYIEDPCPYSKDIWSELNSKNIPLAFDFYGNSEINDFYKVRVLKPKIQDCQHIIPLEQSKNRNICITSMFDNPFGVSITAFEYLNLKNKYPDISFETPGLNCPRNKNFDDFYDIIFSKDFEFNAPDDFGFGFTEQLEKLKWKKL